MTRRPAAVAGRFYPADPGQLEAEVRHHLAQAVAPAGRLPKALVAPHAGYVYSGPVAGSAFRQLEPFRTSIRRVVLLGPSHFWPFRGLALPSARAFATPLGDVPIASDARERLADISQVVVADRPHSREHSLEVELPFLQVALDRFDLVPLSVGDAAPDEVAAVLERLWGGDETLIVISTDLSHFLDYDTARIRDRATADAIVALDPERIGDADACGRHPLRGLLVAARRHGLVARELDLRSSGDTAGERERSQSVVGYGAFALA